MRHVLILAAFLLLWTAALALFSVPDYIVPTPYQLGEKTWFLVTRAGLLWHIPVTAIEILAGYAVGVLIGVGAALLFYRAPMIEDILNPLIVFIQTAPKIAIAPLLLLWSEVTRPFATGALRYHTGLPASGVLDRSCRT